MLRALGLYLHDCDTPMLGIAPASAEPFIDPLLKALDHLPRGAREALFTWGGIATPAASIGARRSSRRGSRAGSSASTLAITRST